MIAVEKSDIVCQDYVRFNISGISLSTIQLEQEFVNMLCHIFNFSLSAVDNVMLAHFQVIDSNNIFSVS